MCDMRAIRVLVFVIQRAIGFEERDIYIQRETFMRHQRSIAHEIARRRKAKEINFRTKNIIVGLTQNLFANDNRISFLVTMRRDADPCPLALRLSS
jgi:hypothetical protein